MLPPNPKDIPALYQRALALQKAGQGAEALGLLNRILLARPKVPEVLFQIGRIEAAAGRAEQAEVALRKALALKPKEAAIWQALYGVLSGASAKKLVREAQRAKIPLGSELEARPILALVERDAEAAETRALALVKAAPSAFWPALTLGQARLAQGKWGAALGPLEMAHSRAPDNRDAQLALGSCLAQMQQPIRAEAFLRPLVPGSIPASLALARLYRTTLRFADATAVLDAVTPKPAFAAALHRDRALCHAALGAVAQAEAAERQAVKAGASSVALAHDLAGALQEAGCAQAALATMERALKAHPGDAALRTRRAQMQQSAGDLRAAEEDLRRVLNAEPGYSEAYRAYFAGQKARADDPYFAQLMAQLARPDLSARARRVMSFAAAKALGDLGRHGDVFAHLARGNRLMAESFPYSFDADLAEARSLVADWAKLKDLDSSSAPRDPVLFVTGLPRSGTTLVETILAAHSQVSAGGELPFLNRALLPAMEGLRAGAPDASDFAAAGARYLAAARRRTGGTLFTDKAISTYSRIGHVLTALPGARALILRRDPRDTGLSMYRNMFPEGTHRYTTDLTAMGQYIRLHEALVDFWAEALPDQVKIVEYEALTAEPEPVIRDIIGFAGLHWEDACLHPERAERRIETLSFAQARQPIGRAAVTGWQRYEAELGPLMVALEATKIRFGASA